MIELDRRIVKYMSYLAANVGYTATASAPPPPYPAGQPPAAPPTGMAPPTTTPGMCSKAKKIDR